MCKVIATFSVFYFMTTTYYYFVNVISIKNVRYCCFVCYCSHKPQLQDTITAGRCHDRPGKKAFNHVYDVLVGLDLAVPGRRAILDYATVLTSLNERIEVRKRTRRENVRERKIDIIEFC